MICKVCGTTMYITKKPDIRMGLFLLLKWIEFYRCPRCYHEEEKK